MGGTRTWLTDAAAYVRAGYDVFPCVAGAKRPIPADGFHAATRDARTLTHWAMRHPDANLAVPTGRGMSAVDLDNDAAAQWFEGAMADAGLDFGPIAFTPRGGLHVWFRDPGRVRCRVGRVSDADLRPGFDVRGVGGYVVVARSDNSEIPVPIVATVSSRGQMSLRLRVFLTLLFGALVGAAVKWMGERYASKSASPCRFRSVSSVFIV